MSPSPSLLPLRTSVGATLQASKWQQSPVLVDASEMKELIEFLGQFWIVQISGVIPLGQEIIPPETFLEVYSDYIEGLKQGTFSKDPRLRSCFSSIWTTTLETLYAVPINQEQCLVKIFEPVIQLQPHRFDYSAADGKFRSMVLGMDSIHWGLQFSYPHLYQDERLQVHTVREGSQFPNTALFKKLQQWVRAHTIATPIEVEGRRVNVPIRLGKKCMSWINHHPQLCLKGLRVIQ